MLAFNSGDGRDTNANLIIAFAGASDYLDGLVARLTGQFSRLGALLDPLVDRLVIVAAGSVIFYYELLPQWLMILLFARETLMLALSIPVLMKGIEIKINWIGRLAVWPLMLGGLLALCLDTWVATALLSIGLSGAYAATVLYIRSILPQLRAGSSTSIPQDLNRG